MHPRQNRYHGHHAQCVPSLLTAFKTNGNSYPRLSSLKKIKNKHINSIFNDKNSYLITSP